MNVSGSAVAGLHGMDGMEWIWIVDGNGKWRGVGGGGECVGKAAGWSRKENDQRNGEKRKLGRGRNS